MHALRRIHASLVPDGLLVDIHPVRPPAVFEAGGADLGALDETEFRETVDRSEEALARSVADGLFSLEAEVFFDWREHFDSTAEAIEAAEEWEGAAIPAEVRERVQAAGGPVTIRERVVARRFRANR